MDLGFLRLRSLKTRLTLSTLVIFVVSIWSLAYYTSAMLRSDMQRMVEQQQASTVSFIAQEINDELVDRLQALEKAAGKITAAEMTNPQTLQAMIEDRLILQGPFNAGVVVIGPDGTAIAEMPRTIGVVGVNLMDRDHVIGALKEGKPTIGRPVMGKKVPSPIFVMAVPVRDPQGQVIGALTGLTDLNKPNFLDKVAEGHYGKTGGYVLVAPQHRVVVTATDKRLTMTPVAGPGIDPLIDRFVQGYEGSGILVNPVGVRVLASARKIPAAGWYVAVALPTSEAFALIDDMHRRTNLITFFLTLLAGGLTWWMLRRELAPLLTGVQELARLAESSQTPQSLPIAKQDEIGDLIAAFNRLLEKLTQRETALRASEERHRTIVATAMDGFWMVDASDRLLEVNDAYCRMSGYTAEELLTMRVSDLEAIESAEQIAARTAKIMTQGAIRFQSQHRRKDGSLFPVEISIQYRPVDGGQFSVFLQDITERKRQQSLIEERNTLLTVQKSELEQTLGRVKRLEGLLSICMSCKKIRAENNAWLQLERYLGEHSDAVFSHGICPECLEKQMKKLD